MGRLRRLGGLVLYLWRLFGALALAGLGPGMDEMLRQGAWYESLLFIPVVFLGSGFAGLFFGIPPSSAWWLVIQSFGLVEGAHLGWDFFGWPGALAGLALGGVAGYFAGLVPMILLRVFLPDEFVTPLLPDDKSSAGA